MKVLLRHHGLNLSGVKTDLYTDLSTCLSISWNLVLIVRLPLGIDSKNPSGIPSTVSSCFSRLLPSSTHICLDLEGHVVDEGHGDQGRHHRVFGPPQTYP